MSEVMEVISFNGYARGSVTLPMECGLLVCLPFGFGCPGQEHRFHIPSLVRNLACSNGGKKAGKQRKKMGKDNHLFPAGKIGFLDRLILVAKSTSLLKRPLS